MDITQDWVNHVTWVSLLFVSKCVICVLSWSIFLWFCNTVIDLIKGRFVIKTIIVCILVLCTVFYVVVSFSLGTIDVDGNANNKNSWYYVFFLWLDKVWTIIFFLFYQYAGGCWFSNMERGFHHRIISVSFSIMGFWSGSEFAEVSIGIFLFFNNEFKLCTLKWYSVLLI